MPLKKITRSYLVCSTPRSGSNLLCEALKNTKLAGRPHQYFWADNERKWAEKYQLPIERDYAAYVQGIITSSATANGVFGFKSMWDFLLDFERRLRSTPRYSTHQGPLNALLADVFPGLRYIHITRRDSLAQAVSLARAIQTQLWTSKQQDSRTAQAEPAFDFELIRRCQEDLRAFEGAWKSFFENAGIRPFEISYEELVANFEETAVAILRYLEIEIPAATQFRPRELKKQGDDLNQRWAEQFAERAASLKT